MRGSYVKSRWDAGQFKLKGRKEKFLSCKCCIIQDFRQEYKEKLMEQEINTFDQDSESFHGRVLSGKYKHYCNEFDGLPIDEPCIEFAYCLCFESSKELKDLQYKQHLEVERINKIDLCYGPGCEDSGK